MCVERLQRRSRPAPRPCRRPSCGRGRCSGRAGRRGWESRRPSCRGAPAGCRPSARRACARRRRGSGRRSACRATWKPVPRMIVSTSRSLPSAPTIERPRTSAIPSLTTSTLGCAERRQVVVGDQDPLAAGQVVGRQLRAQLGVGDLAAQVRLADLAQQRRQRDAEHRDRERLAGPVDRRAHRPLQRREAPVERRARRGVMRRSRRGITHGARALEEVQLRDLAAGSGARTGSRSRRCRSRRRARRRGRGRGSRSPSERRCPRTRAARGSSGSFGSCSGPAPAIRTRARQRRRARSAAASAAPRRPSSAPSTSQPKRTCVEQPLVGGDPRAGRPGSPAAARRSSSSPGSARRRTSRRGSARRSDSPGRCSRARCRRRRRARSRMTKSSRPGALQPRRHRQAGEAAADDRDLDLASALALPCSLSRVVFDSSVTPL